MAKLILSMMELPSFRTAANAGFLSVMVARYGTSKVADDPMIQEARERAYNVPASLRVRGDDERSAISSELRHTHFFERVMAIRDIAEEDARAPMQ